VEKVNVALWRVRQSLNGGVRAVRRFLRQEEAGASLVEYALLVALIALICIVAVAALGTYLNGVFNNVKNALSSNTV
jgi:pilus assembly protein Flp/PilA